MPILVWLFSTATAWAQSNDGAGQDGLLVGTLKSQRASGGVALLRNSGNGLGFYSVTANTTISANTAYVPQAQTILINISSLDNAAADVEEVTRSSLDVKRIYDLQGRRLQQIQPGLNIIRYADGRTVKVLK